MSFISSKIHAYRSKVDDIVRDLHILTQDIGHDELAKTVNDLRARIHEPFLFVIVGEVKAGKSSFINALLQTGREIIFNADHSLFFIKMQYWEFIIGGIGVIMLVDILIHGKLSF